MAFYLWSEVPDEIRITLEWYSHLQVNERTDEFYPEAQERIAWMRGRLNPGEDRCQAGVRWSKTPERWYPCEKLGMWTFEGEPRLCTVHRRMWQRRQQAGQER